MVKKRGRLLKRPQLSPRNQYNLHRFMLPHPCYRPVTQKQQSDDKFLQVVVEVCLAQGAILRRSTPARTNSEAALQVNLEEKHVAFSNDVVAAFDAVMAGFARAGHRTQSNQILPIHRFGFDESAFEIAVD